MAVFVDPVYLVAHLVIWLVAQRRATYAVPASVFFTLLVWATLLGGRSPEVLVGQEVGTLLYVALLWIGTRSLPWGKAAKA